MSSKGSISKHPNPFESGTRKAIPAVLVYVHCEGEFLMIHRNDPTGKDFHQGKWNGLGGKCEADESPLATAIREVHEESGLSLDVLEVKPLGVLQFPNFKAHKNEDWIVFVFRADIPRKPEGLLKASSEGELHWVAQDRILSLNLWPGDRTFLPYVLEGRPFMGTLWYRGGEVEKTWLQKL